MKTITLKRHKEESVLRRHPWVFSGAIHSVSAAPEEGELVLVRSAEGEALGVGHFQIGSIAVRLLEFFCEALPQDFWKSRIGEAYRMRQALGLIREDNTTYRLIHGEGDFLPGLVVDVYGETAVMQAHSVGMHKERERIARTIVATVRGVKNVYYKSETTLPYKAAIEGRGDGYLVGENAEDVALENGLRFHIDWLRGQKTGFFVDQRENRRLVGEYARGRRVLNMFCYTGGFSLYALQGGAKEVVSVDSSEKAVALVEQNVAMNFSQEVLLGEVRHQAVAADAFEYLNGLPEKESGEAFDLIVLDPPAFAKHRGAIHNALQGYQRLNKRALDKIAHGGILFTFSCSQAIDKEMFRLAVFTAAAQAGRNVRILHQLTQPQDHPINIYHPEGEYLKGLVVYVE